ncbi:MAG: SPOR domain-containing protein [Mariprofundus sp.]
MTTSGEWQASLLELRTAWVIAACCIALIFTASVRPDWFEFPTPNPDLQQQFESVESAKKTEPVRAAIQPQKIEPAVQHAQPQAEKPAAVAPAQSKPVVSPKPPAAIVKAKQPAATSSAIANGYYVQIGAFKERSRAQGLTDQLKRQSWNTVIVEKKPGLHAVWIGPKQHRGEAEALLKSIDLKLKRNGFIIHHKKT